jgi:magnesium chelatase subunit I
VVGQEEMKQALLLNMVDPAIGGVLIQGERGCGKSTAVRALTRLLPEIPIVAGDPYNSDPNNPSNQSDEVRDRIARGEQIEIEMKQTPFVELPLGATEDRVTGTIDIEKALLQGGKAFEPGLLARVNRGIFYVDEVNLLDDQLVDVLLDSAAGGWNTVEREGVSVRHPARYLLIGTAHPDEGDLRPQLLDRFGMTVTVTTANWSEWRMQVLSRQTTWSTKPDKVEAQFGPEDEKLKQKVLDARERLPNVTMSRDLAIKISKMCSKLNVDGLRGDIVTNRAARALAAFEGRTEATELDVRSVAVATLQHRLRKNVVSDGVDNTQRVVTSLIQEFGEGPPVPNRGEDNEDVVKVDLAAA